MSRSSDVRCVSDVRNLVVPDVRSRSDVRSPFHRYGKARSEDLRKMFGLMMGFGWPLCRMSETGRTSDISPHSLPHKVSRFHISGRKSDGLRISDLSDVWTPLDIRYLLHSWLTWHVIRTFYPWQFERPLIGFQTFGFCRTSDTYTTQQLQRPLRPLDYKYPLTPTCEGWPLN